MPGTLNPRTVSSAIIQNQTSLRHRSHWEPNPRGHIWASFCSLSISFMKKWRVFLRFTGQTLGQISSTITVKNKKSRARSWKPEVEKLLIASHSFNFLTHGQLTTNITPEVDVCGFVFRLKTGVSVCEFIRGSAEALPLISSLLLPLTLRSPANCVLGISVKLLLWLVSETERF